MSQCAIDKRPYVIVGGGGHGTVLWSLLRDSDLPVLGFIDRCQNTLLMNQAVPYLGSDNQFHMAATDISLANGIGSVLSLGARTQLFLRFTALGYSFPPVIHRFSFVDSTVTLGDGVQVMAGVVIQPNCRIGANSLINTASSVDHDGVIGSHVHIAPGCTLSGGVTVEDGVHIGSGSTIIQGIRIGAASLIAAGSVVIKDVPAGMTMMGHPARAVERTSRDR